MDLKELMELIAKVIREEELDVELLADVVGLDIVIAGEWWISPECSDLCAGTSLVPVSTPLVPVTGLPR